MRKLQAIFYFGAGIAALIFGLWYSQHQSPVRQTQAILPPDFYYDGKAVDPICFNPTNNAEHFAPVVQLNECQQHVDDQHFSNAVTKRDNGELYRELSCGDDCLGAAYVGYRYIGEWNGAQLAILTNAESDNSQYTSLVQLVRLGNQLRISKEFAAGDRCNRGIMDAAVKNGHLLYTQYVTPNDLILLTKPAKNLAAKINLSDDPANCVAEAHFTDDRLTDMTLTQTANDIAPLSEDATDESQACFNQMYIARVKAKQTILDTTKLANFSQEFFSSCLMNSDDRALLE